MFSIERLFVIDRKDIKISRLTKAILRRVGFLYGYIYYKLPFGFPRKNREKMRLFKNKHKGKRCFVIANGPSLKKIDFNLLKDEITIGMNRIYLMKEVNGFMPTYLVSVDKTNQIEQFYVDFDKLDMPCFFNFDLRHLFSKRENQYFIKTKYSSAFSRNVVDKLFGQGKSVTYQCIQLAYYMGFDEVYIIGKDHSYNTKEKVGNLISSTGKEENHFIKGYYKKGQTWGPPDYKSEEFAYSLAKKAFEQDGRIIKDATIGGKLNIFDKIEYETLF